MKERNVLIIAAIILALASLSPLLFMKNPNKYNYNSFKIQKSSTGWITWAYKGEQPYLLQLRYDPKNLEDIKIAPEIRELILSKPALALTIDPKQELKGTTVVAVQDIANILGKRLGLFDLKVMGTTTEFANNETYIVNCNNVQENLNVAWLRVGNSTSISLEKDCIIIEGTTEEELSRAADRLVYHVLQVMN